MRKPIAESLKRGEELFVLLSSVLIFAFSVNFITSCIVAVLGDKYKYVVFIVGLVLCVLGFIFVKRIFPQQREYVFRYEGGIAYKIVHDKVMKVDVAGYGFNDDFFRYLNAFIIENPAFLKYVSEEKCLFCDISRQFDPSHNSKFGILSSVLEVVILNKLSLHLNSYFVREELDGDQVMCLGRKDLGKDVLSNKVLDAISKDMDDRIAFAKHSRNSSGKTVFAINSTGEIYDRINIELPPASSLVRGSDGFLVISTKMFSIKIVTVVNGCNTIINPILMSADLDQRVCPLCAYVKILVSVKGNLLNKRGVVSLYGWLDSFTKELDEYLSVKRLEQKMNVDFLYFLKRCQSGIP